MKNRKGWGIACSMLVFILAAIKITVGMASGFTIFLPLAMRSPDVNPIPTETLIPPGVQVLPNHSQYITTDDDNQNFMHIVGEVMNNTDSDIRIIEITAKIFDSHGNSLDSGSVYTLLENLPAGNKTCFDLELPLPPDCSYYEFESPTYWPDGDPLPNLPFIDDYGSYDAQNKWYTIQGTVRNDQGTPVDQVMLVATLYDESGTVLGCDYTYGDPTYIEAHQTSSFEFTFSARDYFDVRSYRLQVDGNME